MSRTLIVISYIYINVDCVNIYVYGRQVSVNIYIDDDARGVNV